MGSKPLEQQVGDGIGLFVEYPVGHSVQGLEAIFAVDVQPQLRARLLNTAVSPSLHMYSVGTLILVLVLRTSDTGWPDTS